MRRMQRCFTRRTAKYCTSLLFFICTSAYLIFRAFTSGRLDPNVSGRVMVIYSMHETLFGLTHIQGVFSEMFHVLGALEYGQQHGALAIRIEFHNALYADVNPGAGRVSDNYWTYFFRNTTLQLNQPASSSSSSESGSELLHAPANEVHFNSYLSRFGQFGTFSPLVTGSRAVQSAHIFPIDPVVSYRRLHALLMQHMQLNDAMQQKLEQLCLEYRFGSRFMIGLHYRGTDKAMLLPQQNPSHAQYKHYIQAVRARYLTPESKDWALYVATDEQSFLQWCIDEFGTDRVVSLANAPRMSATQTSSRTDYDSFGVHKSNAFSNYDKALSGILDAWLLSRCQYLIKNRSSLSDISFLLAYPRQNFTMLLGRAAPAYSLDDLPPPSPPSTQQSMQSESQVVSASTLNDADHFKLRVVNASGGVR